MYLDIYEAIERRHLVQVYYGGYFRVIEPRVYGCDTRNVDVLKAYQIAGTNELGRHIGWRWLTVSRMDAVTVLSTSFPAPRNEQGLRHKVLQRVYCQVGSPVGLDGVSPVPRPYRHR